MTIFDTSYTLQVIGRIDTPFPEKFGIPRQSHALSLAFGSIEFAPHINVPNACRGLDQFSHLWLSFIFHEHINKPYSDTVRPPRLGGNERIGVFASRATHRPNPLGLSLVKNEGINGSGKLVVSGVDLLSGTPIVDIKPFLGYADSAHDAQCGYAQSMPSIKRTVTFDDTARQQLNVIKRRNVKFEALLISLLEQDPRPAFKHKQITDTKHYYLRLYDQEVKWQIKDGIICVSLIAGYECF